MIFDPSLSDRFMLRVAAVINSFLLVAFFWGESAAFAQVGLSPLVIELKDNRGQSQSVISIENVSDQPFRARIYPQPFTYDPEQGFQPLQSSPNDLTPYLQFSPRELVVPPQTTRLVRLFVRFPPSLPDGEYRTAIFTENLTETAGKDAQGNQVQFASSVATTIYARKGNISADLAVERVSFTNQNPEIRLLIQNKGQATARPQIDWTLKQADTIITKQNLEPITVIAGSKRFVGLGFPKDPKSPLAPGQYQILGQLSWGGEESNQQTLPFSLDFTVPTKAALP